MRYGSENLEIDCGSAFRVTTASVPSVCDID